MQETAQHDDAFTCRDAIPKGRRVATSHIVIALSLALGIFGAWVGMMAFQYGLGTLTSPGVGAWPLIVGCAIAALSLWTLFKELKTPSAGSFNYARPLVLWALIALAAFSMNYISFLASCGSVLSVAFKFIGKISWIKSLLISICITAIVYIIFANLLSVPLP